jgi:hypothetical protein
MIAGITRQAGGPVSKGNNTYIDFGITGLPPRTGVRQPAIV